MAYWLAVPFAGLGVTAIGKGFVSLFHHRHHRHYDERDLSDSLLPAIFHWNNTLLRGQDLERLDGLTLKNMAAMSERAMVSGQGFSVEGTVTEHNTAPGSGLRQGGLSFHVPGLEVPVNGAWITVNQEERVERVEAAFHEMYKAIKVEQATLEDVLSSVAKAL